MKRGQIKQAGNTNKLLNSSNERVAGIKALRLEQMEALSYIKEMLPALRIIAVNAEFKFLAYLLEISAEEVETLSGSADPKTVTQIVKSN